VVEQLNRKDTLDSDEIELLDIQNESEEDEEYDDGYGEDEVIIIEEEEIGEEGGGGKKGRLKRRSSSGGSSIRKSLSPTSPSSRRRDVVRVDGVDISHLIFNKEIEDERGEDEDEEEDRSHLFKEVIQPSVVSLFDRLSIDCSNHHHTSPTSSNNNNIQNEEKEKEPPPQETPITKLHKTNQLEVRSLIKLLERTLVALDQKDEIFSQVFLK